MIRNWLSLAADNKKLYMNIPDQVIYINEDKCRNSYSCVRSCPVNAIEVKPERTHPVIVADRCIGCGLCFLSCSPAAIEYSESVSVVRKLLASGRRTAALVAPSIASEFDDITDYRKFVGMIRRLGFDYVHEVSFGVDLVAYAYKKLLKNREASITSLQTVLPLLKLLKNTILILFPTWLPWYRPWWLQL